MSILSPIKLNTDKKVIASVPTSFDYTDNITNVTLTKKASTVFISKDDFKGTKEIKSTFNTNRPSQKQLRDFIGMQSLIKTCADNAEHIKDELLRIDIEILVPQGVDETEIMKMDFMKLKSNFMDFLKKDVLIKSVEEYSSNQKMKPFRRDFDTFVVDRNTYTHGLLCFLDPNQELIISYINNYTKRTAYAVINTEILISYNNFYKEILKLIKAYRRTRKRGGS